MPDEMRHTPIVVTHESGVRFSAQVRSHRLVVDQPRASGGEDTGPMPIELLGTALGTCIAYYVQQFLQARRLPYTGMRVEVEQRSERNPSRVAEFVARVVIPVPLPIGSQELLERVVRSCPAHNTLARSTQVHVSIEALTAAIM